MEKEERIVGYLTELLWQRDRTIEELQEKVEGLENTIDGDTWGWTIHGQLSDEENMGLPIPRLEMRWFPLDDRGYNWAALYRLVYRHFLGDTCFIPFGYTRRGGDTEPMANYPEDLPLRDGTHIKSDARQLNLPAFVIYKGTVHRIEL